tara:strand:- start:218 stop:574 length:357 start_codon:yes stop_codon:yes gene_type:complete
LRGAAKIVSENDFGLTGDNTLANLATYVSETLGLEVRIMPVDVMQNQIRRYDLHLREILISEALLVSQRQFQLLIQLALLSQQMTRDKIIEDQAAQDLQTKSLLKITLAGYFAAAVMV